MALSPEDAKRSFKAVSKRLKQLYKTEPLEYITKLSPSPAEFLRQHPMTAKSVFSLANLPCACPLDRLRVAQAESMIQCRGDSLGASTSHVHQDQLQTSMHQMMHFMMQGFARMQQLQPSTDINLQLYQRRSLDGHSESSPGAHRFQSLGDALQGAITPPRSKPSQVGSPASAIKDEAPAGHTEARNFVVPAEAPKSLALIDQLPHEQAADDKSNASAMRASIASSRAELLAERAKVAADKAADHKATAKAKAKGKAKASAKSKGKAKAKACGKKSPKPASWLKARPSGCGKCRYCPGCTRSCYLVRGEKVPK